MYLKNPKFVFVIWTSDTDLPTVLMNSSILFIPYEESCYPFLSEDEKVNLKRGKHLPCVCSDWVLGFAIGFDIVMTWFHRLTSCCGRIAMWRNQILLFLFHIYCANGTITMDSQSVQFVMSAKERKKKKKKNEHLEKIEKTASNLIRDIDNISFIQ